MYDRFVAELVALADGQFWRFCLDDGLVAVSVALPLPTAAFESVRYHSEDDEAMLSGLMLTRPERLSLTTSKIFLVQHERNVNKRLGSRLQDENLPFVHTETETQPLMLQTWAISWGVFGFLIEHLGGVSQERYLLTSDFFNLEASFQQSRYICQ